MNITSDWPTNILPTLIRQYEPRLPSNTVAYKTEKYRGTNYSNQRLSILYATYMDGSEKLPLLVIGKSRNPRCMKNCHFLSVLYDSNSKVWMIIAIFEKWLLELDEKFGEQKRHAILFIDNCPAHPITFKIGRISLN